ncbi:MAG: DegT/DnrJ/EryC1/StrS family aminotransferase [Bacteroidota bacterium]|nr:DegT/DnrJ/EryC1/StrS family aminotransferase [Bacteroidota bacterium]MDX5428322.1 DegT/DnrJ/EryC1/StrS family aminotransferase [Bacteroidota bacterium]MDX5446995.1 DegT/DnrJ/EryC1/StrS family aminotransferase [Bacteroidota bacterium]MDX5506099.1 DegT/DnrJ/EryC1/StrS family aminotransferase [Bacteroidota bacterium]
MPGTEYFGAEEKKEVMDVLETGCMFRYNHEHIREGIWKARELEAEVAKFTGAKYAHAVSSGSTAVTSTLAAAGIGFGDEVIVPPFTYIATIEAVIWAGALPVFAEIDETLCLSAEGIKKAITPKTKAVLLVHMCGAAADMDAITTVCRENNLKLIEDAGQALGAFYKGTSVGLFGEAGAFSFDFFKITTAGEGGLCITNSEKNYHIMEQVSDHGHDHIGDNRGMEQHPILGTNFRLSELHAAVGVAQMRKIDRIRADKRRNKAIIKEELSKVDGVSFRHMPDPDGDSGTFLNFFLPTQAKAESVMGQFAKDGIGGCNYWFRNMYHFINQWDHLKSLSVPVKLPIHELGAPQDYHNLELPKTQEVVGRLISLGIRGTWTENEARDLGKKMAKSIQSVL